ncbi:hypothetical protein [Henriciella aquimarina]|uniref:hypothetical protein n=1 Tax=Henriciella aquimarina TaxID=545261 RepID=UPI000A04B8BA|nr:hypothetical protein [Henriciella aquimarina]
MADTPYNRFLGHWQLDPGSCNYGQGEPPASGSYVIREDGDELVFDMAWTDQAGTAHEASFRGKPDGEAVPFNGTDLVDSFAITAESPSELNSTAYLKGEKLMQAIRTLIDDETMRIVQTVYLPDGTAPSNRSVYYRKT